MTGRSESERPSAVLFDMDGVVTDTARAHAETWKRLMDELLESREGAVGEDLRPFDLVSDYRASIDGKPRHDGIRAFARARGIALPEGDPADPESAQTVFGLGRRKQRYFTEWLDANGVDAYPGALRLTRELRARGIPTALFSSSRNAARVLRAAGAEELFDAVVDGSELERLGIPGKPEPAMLLEAAKRLGARPETAAVIEDAISGVQAGVRGGFGLVVGVARGEHEDALTRAGADRVVDDPAELTLTPGGALAVKTVADLPALDLKEGSLRARLGGRRFCVFFDYDGTLTPIVDDPDAAILSEDMREALRRLSRLLPLAIVSGRGLDRLKELVSIDGVTLAGSHGFEIETSGGERTEHGEELLPVLDEAERELARQLEDVPGHQLERKRFAIAVHYRRASSEDAPRVEAAVDEIVAAHPELRKGHGKKVFRVGPALDWHKGHAVLFILERLSREGARPIYPIYVGDDLTDEDAFRALSGRGLTVVVRDHEARATSADFALESVDEVRELARRLASIADEGGPE